MKKLFPVILSVALLGVVFYTFFSNTEIKPPPVKEKKIQPPEEMFDVVEKFLSTEDISNARRKLQYFAEAYPDMTDDYDTWTARIDSVKREVDERKQKEEEIKRQQLEERRKREKTSFARLRSKKDQVTDVVRYYYPGVSQYVNTNVFRVYVTQNKSSLNLIYVICYTGKDWLFIDKYTIRTDDNTYTIDPDEVHRDHDTRVWEWYSEFATSEIDMLEDMAESSKVIIRHHGSQYQRDRVLTQNEKNGIRYAVDGYNYLKRGGNK